MKQTVKAAFLILNYRLNAHEVDRYLFHRLKFFFFNQKACLKYSELRHEKRITGFKSRHVVACCGLGISCVFQMREALFKYDYL